MHYNDFLFTTPIIFSETYALMNRGTSTFEINTNGLLADIHPVVYMLLVFSLIVLCNIAWLNEMRHFQQNNDFINSKWMFLHSLIPYNEQNVRYSVGVTRKCLIIAFALTNFLFSAYYQCNLLQRLMIPKPAPHVTVTDIAERVRSYQSQIMFSDSYAEFEIMDTTSGEIGLLAEALKINPPVTNKTLNLHTGHILVATNTYINSVLTRTHHKQCGSLVLTKIPLKTEMFSIILAIRRKDTLEHLNVIVAERYEHLLPKYNMDQKCLNALSPYIIPDAEVGPLKIRSLSGCFALVVTLLLCAFVVFMIEVAVHKLRGKQTQKNDVQQMKVVRVTSRRWSDSGTCTCTCSCSGCRSHKSYQ